MVTLGLRLHDDFPKHYELFAIKAFSYGRSSFRNHNNLLFNFQGTEGIKTGYTRLSGFNLVASVRRGSRHVIGAVFGGATASRRDDAMRLMLSHALLKASPLKTRRPAPTLVAQARPAQRPAQRLVVAEPRATVVAEPRATVVAEPRVAVVAEGRRPTPPAAASEPTRQVAPAVLYSNPVTVDVARVRPVMVPLRVKNTEAPVQVAAAAPVPLVAPAPVPAKKPMVAAQPAAAVGSAPASAPVNGAINGVGPARGAPPSTLGQQAAGLARGGGQPVEAQPVKYAQASAAEAPFALRGPAAVSATGAGGFEVQIGAFGSAAEADRALATARTAAKDLLEQRAARAIQVQKESRQLYRARFTGFDSKTAAATCLELRRRQIDCFVMKAE